MQIYYLEQKCNKKLSIKAKQISKPNKFQSQTQIQ